MNDLLLAGAIVAVPAMLLFAVGAARRPALAVCLVPLSFPIEQLELDLPLRVIQVASLAAVALVWAHQRSARQPIVARSAVLLAAALVVLSALVSTVVSVDPFASLRLDGGYLIGLAVAATVAVACPDRRSLRLLIGCTCAVGTVICAAGLSSASQLRAHYGASVVDNRGTGFFGQPNELGAFAATMVVLGLALVFSCRRGPVQLLPAASVLVSAGALVVSLSRGSWIGLALGLAVFVLLAPSARRAVTYGLLALSAAVAVAVAALPTSPLLSIVVNRAASFVDGRSNPYDDRPEIWREAVRQIVLRPVLGSGPGGYPSLALRAPSRVATVAPNHAHDLALTLAAEQGLVGVVVLAVAVAVAAVAVVRTLRRYEPWPRDVRETAVPAGVSRADRRPTAAGTGGEGVIGQGVAPGRTLTMPDVTIPGLTVPRRTVASIGHRTVIDTAVGDRDNARRPVVRSSLFPKGTPGILARVMSRRRIADHDTVALHIRERAPGERELLAGAVAGLAVVLGQGLVDYSLRNPVLATMVWLLIGLLAATVSDREKLMRRGAGEPGERGSQWPYPLGLNRWT